MQNYLTESYNLDDPSFTSFLDETSLWSVPFGLQLLETVEMRRGMTVLDIGSGLGFPAIELAMRLGNSSKIYGIDPWKAGIARAEQKIKGFKLTNIFLKEGAAEKLPFDDHYFDLVVSNNGINNVQNILASFRECNRTMKPDAQFVFTMNLEDSFKEFYQIFRHVLREEGLDHEISKLEAHIYEKRKPVREIMDLLHETGFDIKEIKNGSFSYRFVDGTTMFNHFFIKIAFLDAWKHITGHDSPQIFSMLEQEINERAARSGGFTMTVPFSTFNCRKKP